MLRLVVTPPRGGGIEGVIPVPASKYHAHRALLLGSLAEGRTQIAGRTEALHVRMTLAALRRLGTGLRKLPDGYEVDGGPYRPQRNVIDVGSSGSTLQFLLGLGCRSVGPALTFDGQRSFRRRPIGPLLDGLRTLGVRLTATGDGLPVTVLPGRPRGGQVRIRGTLSQWVSGLLLLAPLASGDTEIRIEGPVNETPYLDLTVAMMAAFGIEVRVGADHRQYQVAAGQRYLPATYRLPADLSSAAYGLLAAAIVPSDVTFLGIERQGDHPERAILDILAAAGVPMAFDDAQRTLRIRQQGRPRAVTVDCAGSPDLIPVLCVLGAVAEGTTVLDHVGHARLKESDRIAAMLQLRRMGARIDEDGPDRLVIHGVPRLRAAALSSYNDHRVLMALAIAGSVADGGRTEISYPQAYRLSYPEFAEHMRGLGLGLVAADADQEAEGGPWSTVPTPGAVPEIRSMMPAAWTARQRATGLWPQRLITDYLDEAATWTPDRPAIVDGSGTPPDILTYAACRDAVDRIATALCRLGVQPGEPVAFQLPNWWEFVVLQLALVRIGAVSCPLMPIFRERELTFMLRQSGCRLLVVPQHFRGFDYPAMVAGLRGQLPALERVLVCRGPDGPDAFARLLDQPADARVLAARRPAPDAITQLLYTSGTSGEPKGVLHTHNTLLGGLVAHARHFRLTDADPIFIPSPAAHQTGFLYGMWLAIFLGATAVYQDAWDPELALSLMDTWRISFVQAATPFLTDLTEGASRRGRAPAGLRIFVATGAPVPRVTARLARSALRCEVMGGWGTTESGLVAGGAPGDPAERLWQTDGRVLELMQMRVAGPDGSDLAPGTEGRFLVRTPGMFVGYLGHPEWYERAFVGDRWFDTGDLATIDADGYMRITGRTKDIINRGGEKIPVAEIEQCLYAHPAVAELAVVGMPDPRLGERACAVVVLRPGTTLTLPDVQAHLLEARMAKQYWPERLEVVARMPRTPSGKIQKFVLRQQVAEQLASEHQLAAAGEGRGAQE